MSTRDIHRQLWPDTFVTDGSLAVLVAEILAAPGDNVREPVFIRTLHRFGYAFVGPVVEIVRAGSTLRPVQCWLAADNQRARLEPGDNVVGRDPLASIRVPRPRRASLHRRDRDLEASRPDRCRGRGGHAPDLSSRNGTFVDEVRVTTPVLLRDGAAIRLESVSLRFRRLTDVSATKTQEVAHEHTATVEEARRR